MQRMTYKSIVGDLFGGVTASVIALPLALAFGVASGVGAQAGIYGAIILGFVAALAGGTKVQISGPTGPMTIVAASTLVLFHGDVALLMAAVLLTGLFQIILGLLKVGKFVKFVPYPVISGFMSGIGIIIILLQINPLFGIEGVSSPIRAVTSLGNIFSLFQTDAVYASIIALGIVFFTPKKLAKIIPTPLLALILVTLIAQVANFQLATIGTIPSGLPEFIFPSFNYSQIKIIVSAALSLAVLGAIDSLLTSLVADSITKTEHNSNRELIGQGLGNTLTAFVGGIPGAGATMRTVVNVKSGGTTRLSGVIHALILLGILLGLGKYAAMVPMAVLAAILIKVGLDIVDYRFIKIIKKAPKHDLAIMFTVLLLTVFVDLIMAVGVGVVLATVLLAVRMSSQVNSSVKDVEISLKEIEGCENKQVDGNFNVRVVDIDGPFFFGSTTRLVGQVGAMLGTKIVIFNCLKVPFIDLSAFFALGEIILKLKENGIVPFVVVSEDIRAKLIELDASSILPEKHIYLSFDLAVDHAREHICENRF
ncbi:MAG: SulP family inorganic anion transporter [Deltaproteobacteria bacterium]|jgi:SulP family sulfate permease|nr:SulP family inorganic anion transporter [Deltaproteobacteria bacterium]MCW8892855.1 SulP family inorganic anion transporter [Deltaproteobacteria bacterium]MCW9049450.1 SulP family inorganic anion transporter [Deltaproteobacteria bacterium]